MPRYLLGPHVVALINLYIKGPLKVNSDQNSWTFDFVCELVLIGENELKSNLNLFNSEKETR